MLVLSRKINQEIVIGDSIKIRVIKSKGNTVRLGIEAPDHVRIVRGELERHESAPASDQLPAGTHRSENAANDPANSQRPIQSTLLKTDPRRAPGIDLHEGDKQAGEPPVLPIYDPT